ncbi:hypothetical protein A1O3_09390 [Capronia epimyces CBS 606.96]|uniref:NADP-dependent oxidoreductase domain-containing protein n=1 Tax=Capronia epimyces CBS 606.96 TaxID=1182542 RepID=W9Y735_9EURO|nr:uncharacterized protein A1O3_09390 [Capronia epimyces CBS 606.96]EXJ78229.1 hypothetical protein A1O3_09390 [Capronia epimyces CBS 606.96]
MASMVSEFQYPVLLSGSPLPIRIYGTAFGPNRPVPHVIDALREGYRAIDTASTRKVHNEVSDGEDIATALQDAKMALKREDLFIQTKFAPAWTQAEPWAFDVGDDLQTQVYKSALRSGTALKVDAIDAYLLLQPMGTMEETRMVWQAMEDIYHHGGVRYLGICKADLPVLASIYEKATVKPSIVQNRFTHRNQYDKLVLDYCKEHKICYQAWGVFSEENKAVAKAVMGDIHARGFRVAGADFDFFLQCIMAMNQRQAVMFHIVDGSSNVEHMRQNLKIGAESASIGDDLIVAFRDALDQYHMRAKSTA